MGTPHAPEWTDGNSSDPGITLLELLAYSVFSLALIVVWWRRTRRRQGARVGGSGHRSTR
jgi:hypothetical protein